MASRGTPPTLDDHLSELLDKFPRLSVQPDGTDGQFTENDELRLVGSLALDNVELTNLPRLEGSYRIKVIVPRAFPAALPRVYEVGGSIEQGYHKWTDGTLCLGAPLDLRAILTQTPTLLGFVSNCVVPYLYRHRYREVHHTDPWSDLRHGSAGLLQYYDHLIGTSDPRACLEYLHLGGLRKRVANKYPCPCGSGLRLGKCHHLRLNRLRDYLGRSALRAARKELKHWLDTEA